MPPYVLLILLIVAVRAARGYPGHYLRRLVRNLTVLAIVMLIMFAFENRITLSDLLYYLEARGIIGVLILVLMPWILVDLIPMLKERTRSSG